MKKCCDCGFKPKSEFNKHNGRKDGLCVRCRTCQQNKAREYYRKNKKTRDKAKQNAKERAAKLRKQYDEYKSTLKCKLCEEDHPATLDFHHRDSSAKEKEVADARVHCWSWKRILKEIAKCDVLCANCHRKLHWEKRKV